MRSITTLGHNPSIKIMGLQRDILVHTLVCLVYINRLLFLPLLVQSWWKNLIKINFGHQVIWIPTFVYPPSSFTFGGSFDEPKPFYVHHDGVSPLA